MTASGRIRGSSGLSFCDIPYEIWKHSHLHSLSIDNGVGDPVTVSDSKDHRILIASGVSSGCKPGACRLFRFQGPTIPLWQVSGPSNFGTPGESSGGLGRLCKQTPVFFRGLKNYDRVHRAVIVKYHTFTTSKSISQVPAILTPVQSPAVTKKRKKRKAVMRRHAKQWQPKGRSQLPRRNRERETGTQVAGRRSEGPNPKHWMPKEV